MRYFRVKPVWRGRTVVVIAGGPSVTIEDMRRVGIARLNGKIRVIAIKDAVFPAWWADWVHGCDAMWWQVHIQQLQWFSGRKTTLVETLPAKWGVHVLRNTGRHGFDEDPATCRSGGNSGYQAMHCAIHAGASRIVMLGMDLKKTEDGRRHWFESHPYQAHTDYAETMLPSFETLLPVIEERRIEVVNCSTESIIDCFPKRELRSVL